MDNNNFRNNVLPARGKAEFPRQVGRLFLPASSPPMEEQSIRRLENKKIAVLGLGLEGQDICRFLLRQKARITVFDQKEVLGLGEIYQEFRKRGVLFSLGKNYLKDGFSGFDYLFRSPGFKRFLPEIVEAEKKGCVVSSATKLFFDLCPAKIVGVTGTKGKGTTATLIYRILKKDKRSVFLAGNIGRPMLSLLPKLKPSSWVVLELSSFQLQDVNKSPHIAVVLFITSEHLDYHRDTKEYIEAKSNIVRFQNKKDVAVLNADNKTSASFSSLTKGKVFWYSRQESVDGVYVKNNKIFLFDKYIGKTDGLKIPGSHNWENVCAATAASFSVGAKIDSIKKAIFSFKGLEHRLEFVGKADGVEYYNDSFSTTPETTIAAIKSFKNPILLIAGGSGKGSDYSNLGKEISHSSVKTLILVGLMAPKIRRACVNAKFSGETISQPKSMEEAVGIAAKKAKPGDIVLLSPACASFDMFKNYKDRGEQFKRYAQEI